MYVASVVYPRSPEGRFDFEYFAGQHVPMFANLLGDNCRRYEVHAAVESPGAPPPTFVAAAYFWVETEAAFGAVLASHGQEIYSDVPRFTDLQPTRTWAEVRASGPE